MKKKIEYTYSNIRLTLECTQIEFWYDFYSWKGTKRKLFVVFKNTVNSFKILYFIVRTCCSILNSINSWKLCRGMIGKFFWKKNYTRASHHHYTRTKKINVSILCEWHARITRSMSTSFFVNSYPFFWPAVKIKLILSHCLCTCKMDKVENFSPFPLLIVQLLLIQALYFFHTSNRLLAVLQVEISRRMGWKSSGHSTSFSLLF